MENLKSQTLVNSPPSPNLACLLTLCAVISSLLLRQSLLQNPKALLTFLDLVPCPFLMKIMQFEENSLVSSSGCLSHLTPNSVGTTVILSHYHLYFNWMIKWWCLVSERHYTGVKVKVTQWEC
jgi:hypothetical protein